MDNTASICINQAGVNKIKELTGRDDTNFQVINFAEMSQAPAGDKPAAD